jgi:tryptophanyl-tRNA synthetase
VKKKIVSLTADRPTGSLHLGHFIGSLKKRVEFQESYNQYVMIADVQALTDYFDNPGKIIDNTLNVVADYLAVGIDPNLSTIFIQSQIPALPELMMYYMNLVTISRLERNPTVKTELSKKKFSKSITAGFMCYPISQAADITAFKAEVVPVGADQIPLIEQTNEIIKSFNKLYNTKCLKKTKPILSNVSKLTGIDGKAKASKSLNNAIFLDDSPETIKQKVYSMFTDPNHIKVSDPGEITGNVVFEYLDAFYKDKNEISELKAQYRKGGLGDVTLKSMLNKTLQNLLLPIREKKLSIKKEELVEICFDGTKKAKTISEETLREVKDAIGIKFLD